MRALVHVGLAVMLVIAPALCCCNLHYLTGRAGAAPHSAACPVCPQTPTPAPVATPELLSCCERAELAKQAAPTPLPQPENKPAPQPRPRDCPACERPDATTPELSPEVAAPEFTGVLLFVAFFNSTALPLEHLGLLGGLDPPERAGVDTRAEALFSRHVMRC